MSPFARWIKDLCTSYDCASGPSAWGDIPMPVTRTPRVTGMGHWPGHVLARHLDAHPERPYHRGASCQHPPARRRRDPLVADRPAQLTSPVRPAPAQATRTNPVATVGRASTYTESPASLAITLQEVHPACALRVGGKSCLTSQKEGCRAVTGWVSLDAFLLGLHLPLLGGFSMAGLGGSGCRR